MKPSILSIALLTLLSLSNGLANSLGNGQANGLAAEPNCDIKEDPIWYACAKDKDCAFVNGACHHPVAIASKYKKPAAGFHACEAMRANCVGTASPKTQVAVQCVQKKCKIAN